MKIPNKHYLIVDLEATCSDDNSFPRSEMEIIEIGACMVDSTTYEIVDEISIFVRPVRNPILTPFCKKLTSITQEQVDLGVIYETAINVFKSWLSKYEDYVFCSWGAYDKRQIKTDCEFHGVKYPFDSEDHINLKQEFSNHFGIKKGFGMAKALDRLGMVFQGTPHRGIDDTKNTAYIIKKVLTEFADGVLPNKIEMKMYALVKESVPYKHAVSDAITACIQTAIKYDDRPDTQFWKDKGCLTQVCVVNDKEFEAAKEFEDFTTLKNQTWGNNETVIAFAPRAEYPNRFGYYKSFR
jgi:inhibitor of KinA sporulation pathway (predicted exonuclease)